MLICWQRVTAWNGWQISRRKLTQVGRLIRMRWGRTRATKPRAAMSRPWFILATPENQQRKIVPANWRWNSTLTRRTETEMENSFLARWASTSTTTTLSPPTQSSAWSPSSRKTSPGSYNNLNFRIIFKMFVPVIWKRVLKDIFKRQCSRRYLWVQLQSIYTIWR